MLTIKGVDYRCILWGVSKNEAVNILNNSVLEDKGNLYLDFSANTTPVEGIKQGAFGGTYLETFILVLLKIGTESHGKNLIS